MPATPALQTNLFGSQTQWQLDAIQLVNWGTFDGHHDIRFRRDYERGTATVVCGASGTGKSTMQDAYDEVLMRAPRYNAASNVGGRGSGAASGKRSLLTYLRGMVDSHFDETTGTERADFLRDASCARWGAIALTFMDGMDNAFTAAKLYYLTPDADNVDARNTRYLTSPARLDLRLLDGIASKPFDKRGVDRVFPECRQFERQSEFLDYVYRELGMGGAVNGRNLMELLARIRAGRDFRTVNHLFDELVLETPLTFAAADRAIEHFDAHNQTYERMVRAQRQLKILEPIADHKHSYDQACLDEKTCAAVGTIAQEGSLIGAWSVLREEELVHACSEEAGAEHARACSLRAELEERGRAVRADISQLQEDLAGSGMARLETLDRQVEDARQRLGQARAARRSLEERVGARLGAIPDDAAPFEEMLLRAGETAARFEEADRAVIERRDAIVMQLGLLKDRAGSVRDDLEYYRNHAGNIPRPLHEARAAMAREAGLDVSELPFAAELMDLKPDQERWRLAAETALHGLARTILVDADAFERLSRRIDPLKLPARVTFQAVDLSDDSQGAGVAGGIADKLIFDAESPFSPWVSRAAASPRCDALCVDGAAELAGEGLRITPAGQMRSGQRGSHGRNKGDANILGFSNEATVTRLTEELAGLQGQLMDLQDGLKDLDARSRELRAEKEACDELLRHDFAEVDVAGASAALAALEDERTAFLAAHDKLLELQGRLEVLVRERDELLKRTGVVEQDAARAQRMLDDLAQRGRALAEKAERARRHPGLADEAEGAAALLDQLAAASNKGRRANASAQSRYEGFPEFMARLERDVQNRSASAQRAREAARNSLESRLALYRAEYPDANLGTTIESYGDYAAILEELRRAGIHQQLDQWRASMVRWIAEDLVPLTQAYARSERDMEDRIDPINRILANLPFGPDHGRLQIVLRKKEGPSVADFRRRLAEHASQARTAELDVDAFYQQVSKLLARLRPGSDERNTLLDRRLHVDITAKAVWPPTCGREASVYSSLGGKSGGEVQELVAFILGSALLYCLGNDAGDRPAFAPVMLDEGFIKADSAFTARAVTAWRSFGFQLIVATPEDKYQSIAPFVEQCIYIGKTAANISYATSIDLEGDAETPAGAEPRG